MERLVEELKGLQLLVVTPSSFSVANGAETVFNRGLKCLETVKRNPSVENFHELRKVGIRKRQKPCLFFFFSGDKECLVCVVHGV